MTLILTALAVAVNASAPQKFYIFQKYNDSDECMVRNENGVESDYVSLSEAFNTIKTIVGDGTADIYFTGSDLSTATGGFNASGASYDPTKEYKITHSLDFSFNAIISGTLFYDSYDDYNDLNYIYVSENSNLESKADIRCTNQGFANQGTGTINISGGTVSSIYFAAIYNNSTGTINISGGTVSSIYFAAIYNNSTGAINISGGKLSSTDLDAIRNDSTGKITISQDEGKTTLITSAGGNANAILLNNGTANETILEINGGTVSNTNTGVTGGLAISNNGVGDILINSGEISTNGIAIQNYSTGSINISGGKISSTDRMAISNLSTGKITISQNEGKTTLVTSASEYEGTISLDNGTANETILEINGGTVSNTGESNGIYNYGVGDILINGGEIIAKGIAISNDSTGKITISQTNENIPTLVTCAGDYQPTISLMDGTANETILEINGGTVSNTGEIDGIENNGVGDILINGGEVIAKNTTIYNASTGAINISGGKITSTNNKAIRNDSTGKITISQTNENIPTLVTGAKDSQSTIFLTDGTANETILEINGGTVSNTGENVGIENNGVGDILVNGGEVSTKGIAIFNGSTGAVNISSGTVSSTADNAIFNYSTGKITISQTNENIPTLVTNANSDVPIITLYSGTANETILEINGGTVSHMGEIGRIAIANIGVGDVLINGGEVSAKGVAIENNSTGALTITGGTVSSTANNAIFNVSTGKITISQDEGKTTLVTSADEGASTILLNNGTANETILEINGGTVSNTGENSGKAISNNSVGDILINGGEVSAKAAAIVNNSTGALTITGGKISSTANNAIGNYSTGKITISQDEGKTTLVTSAGEGAITIFLFDGTANETILAINGGTVSNTYTGENSGLAISNNGVGDILINGGEISTKGIAIQNYSTGALTITGGKISSTANNAIFNGSTGKITISQDAGKTTLITSASDYQSTISLTNEASNETILEINGGTVSNTNTGENGGLAIMNNGFGDILINGGEILSEENSTIFNQGNGNITITQADEKFPTIIMNNSKDYATIFFHEQLFCNGSLSISGGTIQNKSSDGTAVMVMNNELIYLTGSPTIIGQMSFKNYIETNSSLLATTPINIFYNGTMKCPQMIVNNCTDASMFVLNNTEYTLFADKTKNILYVDKQYNINIDTNIKYGTISANTTAVNGEKIIVTITPDKDFELASLSYNDGAQTVKISDKNGVYSFIMPQSDVTINAVFKTHPVLTNPIITALYGTSVEKMPIKNAATNPNGVWSWTDKDKKDIPNVGSTKAYEMTFTPADSKYFTEKISVVPNIMSIDITGISAKNITETYNNTAIKISVTGLLKDDKLTFSTEQNGTYTAEHPICKDVGTYTVWYKVQRNSCTDFINYATITINKADITGISAQNVYSKYDGTAKTISIIGLLENDIVTYSSEENGTYSAEHPICKASGEYTIWYKLSRKNYNDFVGSASIIINDNIIEGITAEDVSAIYDGASKKITISGTLEGDIVTYSTSKTDDFSTTELTYTNAGAYTVWFKIQRKDAIDFIGSATITISKKTITIQSVEVKDKVFDKTNTAEINAVEFSGLIDQETLVLNTDYTATAVFDNETAGTGKNVVITIALGENTNYCFADSESASFTAKGTINKKQSTANSIPTPVVYGNSKMTLADAALPDGWKWVDSLDTPIENAVDGIASYDAMYCQDDGTNYTPIVLSINITIVNEITITATATDGGSITPNGIIKINKGDSQQFVITADEGFAISKVYIDSQDMGAISSYTFENVSENHTIDVVFELVSADTTTSVTTSDNTSSDVTTPSETEITTDGDVTTNDNSDVTSSDNNTSNDTSNGNNSGSDEEENPNTGITMAFGGVILSAIAVAVSRKRNKK